MKKLLWITDPHLDHLSPALEDAWFEKLANARADMLLLGGDLANARVFHRILSRIKQEYPGEVALVAGNHDYYHTSIAALRAELAMHHRAGTIIFEPGCQTTPLPLADGVYLCGSGGWGDATAGFARASGISLNDELLIAELRTHNLTQKLRELGTESANHLQHQLDAVPADATDVIILTHVPPWPDACWHQGRKSDTLALARFCWQAGGDVISQAAAQRPQTRFIVLCGHTHSDGLWQHENITCHTAGSTYGRIHHSAVITIGKTVSVEIIDR
jgi:3',5'-cyclic-AMP phosphodiesterase